MSKRIEMTRERKIALPIILEAARNYGRVLNDETPAVARDTAARLAKALEAFNV